MTTQEQRAARSRGGGKVDLGRFAPEETMGFLIWDTIRTFHRTFQKLVSLHGINFGLWPFLRALWTQDGVGVRELSQRVYMAPPTTLKAIVRLEKAGLAYRTPDKNDARKTLIYLSAKGRKLFSRVVPHMDYVNRMAVKGVSKFEQEQVKRLLKHMRANMANQTLSNGQKPQAKNKDIRSSRAGDRRRRRSPDDLSPPTSPIRKVSES